MAKTVAQREGSNQCWILVMGNVHDSHPRSRCLSAYEHSDSRSKQSLEKQETIILKLSTIYTDSLVTAHTYIARHTAAYTD